MLDAAGEPAGTDDIIQWAEWIERSLVDRSRVVAQTALDGGVEVSMVFLGLNHGFGTGDKPVLWETMIFGGPQDDYCDRYCSRAEALAGHTKAVRMATTRSMSFQEKP